MDKVLLDTDVFSELLRRQNRRITGHADAYLAEHGKLTLTVITVMEVVKGLQQAQRPERIAQVLAAIRGHEVLVLDTEGAVTAGRIYGDLVRTGRTIGRADPQIAGIAIAHDLPLVTGNKEHYQRVQELGYVLRLEDWHAGSPRRRP